MKTFKTTLLGALVAACLAPLGAHAAMVLDTGTPAANADSTYTLNGSSFVAAEFSLGGGQTITSIEAYLTAGLDAPGDTFSVALYSANDFGSVRSQPVFTGQASYQADGWNGLTGLDLAGLDAGNYWAAVEVGTDDNATGLNLPGTLVGGGSKPALGFAFNAGDGYQQSDPSLAFGMQVEVAPVPLPGALLLLGSGLAGLGGIARRRRVDAIC